MKRGLLAGVCAAALALCATSTAVAQDGGSAPDGPATFYISLFGGVAIPEDLNGSFTTSDTGLAFDFDQDLDIGFVIGGAVGTNLGEYFRIEGEVSYARVDAGNAFAVFQPGGSGFSYAGSGDVGALFVLANLWFDIPLNSPITPYLGGGIGAGIVDTDITLTGPDVFVLNDNDTGFAFQVGAGFIYALTEWLSLELGYRFKGITDFTIDVVEVGGGPQNAIQGADLYIHQVFGGVTISLGGLGGP